MPQTSGYAITLYKYRKFVFVATIIATAGVLVYGVGVIGNLGTEGFYATGVESDDIKNEFSEKFVPASPEFQFLMQSSSHNVSSQYFIEAYGEFRNVTASLPLHAFVSVFEHASYVHAVSEDRKSTIVTARLSPGVSSDTVKQSQFDSVFAARTYTDVKVYPFGEQLVNDEVSSTIIADLLTAEIGTLPVVIFIMIVTFRGVVASLPALLVAFCTIAFSLAAVRLVNQATPLSEFATNVITLVGLGVSVDYSLFVVLRFMEERRSSPSAHVAEIASRVLATSGRMIFFSAMTVALSISGTFFFHEYYVYSMGLAIILVVCVACLSSLTLLLATLMMLDHRIFVWSLDNIISFITRSFVKRRVAAVNAAPTGPRRDLTDSEIAPAPSLPPPNASVTTSQTPDAVPEDLSTGLWYRATILSMRFAVPLVALIVAGLSGLLAVFVKDTNAGSGSPLVLPLSSATRFAYVQIVSAFPTEGRTSLDVYVQTASTGGVFDAEFLTQLDSFSAAMEAMPLVTQTTSIVRFGPSRPVADYISAYAAYRTAPDLSQPIHSPFFLTNMVDIIHVIVDVNADVFSGPAKDVIKATRNSLLSTFGTNTDVIVFGVTGVAAQNFDTYEDVTAQLPKWLATMLASIYLLILVMTGSVFLPLKAIATALLSLAASMGVIILVFQQGHGQSLLQFESSGYIDGLQLIFIFSLAFGLSMDYELFILSRVQEYYLRFRDNRVAVASGIQKTGRAVTMAAIVLTCVMTAFISSRTEVLKLIGFGTAFSIVIDAVVVRMVLVPGMMALLGPLNWWAPAFMRRAMDWFGSFLREPAETDFKPERSGQASRVGDITV